MAVTNLSPAEQAIVMLLRRRKRWSATDELCATLDLTPHTLKSLVWRLRQKGVAIESGRGLGYRMERGT